jgi:predicted TIM-barrel fold metal-dependent hydrolase
MIIDSHVHLFSDRIIAGVSARKELVRELDLDTRRAADRTSEGALVREGQAAGLDACLLLPVAGPDEVRDVNRSFQAIARDEKFLLTGGTLHPDFPGNEGEISRLREAGIRAIKLCSFSQGFDPAARRTRDLLDRVQQCNIREGGRFFVIIDTFYRADIHFGSPARFLTTPARLGALVEAFPGIDFVAAHMGGLTAPVHEILDHLPPRENLYLETSNAAHTLQEEEFVLLLERHGPERILFGTDWPWFGPRDEMRRIDRLLDHAGYSGEDKARVFGMNACRLLGMIENAPG